MSGDARAKNGVDADVMTEAEELRVRLQYVEHDREHLAAEVSERDRRVTELLRALIAEFDANGNGCELGDPSADAWHKASHRVRATLTELTGLDR
jgi:hypothetical protein